jgi:hypothetical protein
MSLRAAGTAMRKRREAAIENSDPKRPMLIFGDLLGSEPGAHLDERDGLYNNFVYILQKKIFSLLVSLYVGPGAGGTLMSMTGREMRKERIVVKANWLPTFSSRSCSIHIIYIL